ncbi:MAG: segregation/condensation protein A, partial [Clostridia bacterium]
MEPAYRVQLEVYEGPLELLYQLVEKEQIDIWDIPIARLTDQYLAYLDTLQQLNIDVAADFLVMAARLLYIKAKMLLPRPEAA